MPSGSSPLTGSSNMSTGGSPSSAAAMPSRCAIPARSPRLAARNRGEADELEHLVDAAAGGRCSRQPASRWSRARRPGCVAVASSSAPTSRSGAAQVAVAPATDERLAGVRRVEAEDQAHRRRLPGAVRPHEAGDAARVARRTTGRRRRASVRTASSNPCTLRSPRSCAHGTTRAPVCRRARSRLRRRSGAVIAASRRPPAGDADLAAADDAERDAEATMAT